MAIWTSRLARWKSARKRIKINREIIAAYFDEAYYLARNPDVALARHDALDHYVSHGWREGRNPSPWLDTLWYLLNIDNAAKSGLDPLSHLDSLQRKPETTTASPDQPIVELMSRVAVSPDVPKSARSYASEYELIARSHLLDVKYYCAQLHGNIGDPIEHYIRIGWSQGRNPCVAFDSRWYLETYKDVGVLNINPLTHYLRHGFREGRKPNPRLAPSTKPQSDAISVNESEDRRDPKSVGAPLDEKGVRNSLCERYLHDLAAWPSTARIAVLENLVGRRFIKAPKVSREFIPFNPIPPHGRVEQYFVAPVEWLHSLNLYFFTYCEPNGATLRVSVHALTANASLPLKVHDQIIARDTVVDGHSLVVWLDKAIGARDTIFLISIDVEDLLPGSRVTIAGVRPSYDSLVPEPQPNEEGLAFAIDFNVAPPKGSFKTFAFISGCPGDAFRYRCEHQAEAVGNAGFAADVFQPFDFPYQQLLTKYSIVVAHRVPNDGEFQRFAEEARRIGLPIVYDVDDLVFDPNRVLQIDAYNAMTRDEKAVYLDGVRRYNAAMSRCPLVSVSTLKLMEVAKELFPEKPAFVVRNKVSEIMLRDAESAFREPRGPSPEVWIAYFSGSRTHSKDFSACVNALAAIMRSLPQTRLLIVGHLEVPDELKAFQARVSKREFMPWRELPAIYRRIDINLASLEYENEFTEAKSALKWLEAAVVRVPTIASDLGAFREAITNNVNGLLCSNDKEWIAALTALIQNPAERGRIGDAAYKDVIAGSSSFSAPSSIASDWRHALTGAGFKRSPGGLKVAFVTRAPIAKTSGGYKKIFILAKYLSDRGYDASVHVEAIAHLADMTDEEIKDYCAINFSVDRKMIRVGHGDIGPSDVAIATNWPTAPAVAHAHNVKFKAYFIQDFEPEFYEFGSAEYVAANQTYDAPLAFITFGAYLANRLADRRKWVQSIPFAIDERFHAAGRARGEFTSGRSVILFFARPGIPRRNFEQGVIALTKIGKVFGRRVRIKLYGLEEPRALPFEYENLGVLSQERLAEELARADIHLSFSLTNISTVIYEAMACGCACVEADVESVRGMVRHGENCLLSKPDGQSVFSSLQELIDEPARRERIARAGQEFARNLTEERMCEAFANCLENGRLN